MMFDNSFMFSFAAIIPVIVVVGFIVIFTIIIVTFIRSTRQWHNNNRSPVLTVPARVVTKRTASRRHAHTDTMQADSYATLYYTAFEYESGDRQEFALPGEEYGLLAEGDTGRLTFQGTRYLGFERIKNQ